ncbi:MAG: hypothetical protein K9H49_17195 [Bacteroidales bacterium]|nr:hypothetical protein [Bacteroidales bacterium]MCF8406148.1 hypothetical protein [Bacteroidales bacterium]
MNRINACAIGVFLILSSCNQLNTEQFENNINSNEELQEYLLQGWGSWNSSNLLEHVLMPEGLSIRISFRTNQSSDAYPYYLDQSYITSSYFDYPEEIEPLYHSYNGDYTDLRITWKGLTARVQTATQKGEIYILYTPEILPEDPSIMIVETGILWNKEGRVEKKTNFFQAEFGPITYNIEATEDDSMVPLPLMADYLSFRSDKVVGIYSGKKRTLEYVEKLIADREELINSQNEIWGDFVEIYKAAQNVLGWNLIYDANNNRAITPGSRIWNENWGGWVLFNWDSYFTAAMYALDNKFLAYSSVIAITDEITETGFVPNFSTALMNKKSWDRSQPPVGSLITKMIYDKYPEKWFLEEVYDNLLSWNRWWVTERENMGYLSWGSSPLPQVPESNSKQAALNESGLDNSPLFDEAQFSSNTHMLNLASVDLMSLYIADCKSLAEIADILGNEDDKQELLKRAEKYSQKLSTLWDEEDGIYRDMYLSNQQFSNRLAPTSFYPLLAGVPSQEQAERMIKEHFMNPDEFLGEFMLPSISRDDPAFSDNSYWRGRIWGPMNFLVYLGLQNYDLPEASRILADKSSDLLMKEWLEDRRVYENYNALTGEGNDVSNSDGFYSWGGLLALIKLMEEGFWE